MSVLIHEKNVPIISSVDFTTSSSLSGIDWTGEARAAIASTRDTYKTVRGDGIGEEPVGMRVRFRELLNEDDGDPTEGEALNLGIRNCPLTSPGRR